MSDTPTPPAGAIPEENFATPDLSDLEAVATEDLQPGSDAEGDVAATGTDPDLDDLVDYTPPSGSFFRRFWVAIVLSVGLFAGAVVVLSGAAPDLPYRLPSVPPAVPSSGCVTADLQPTACDSPSAYAEVLAVERSPAPSGDAWEDALALISICDYPTTASAEDDGVTVTCLGAPRPVDWSTIEGAVAGDCFDPGASPLVPPLPVDCETGALVTITAVELPDPPASADAREELELYSRATVACMGLTARGPSFWQWRAGNGSVALCLGSHS